MSEITKIKVGNYSENTYREYNINEEFKKRVRRSDKSLTPLRWYNSSLYLDDEVIYVDSYTVDEFYELLKTRGIVYEVDDEGSSSYSHSVKKCLAISNDNEYGFFVGIRALFVSNEFRTVNTSNQSQSFNMQSGSLGFTVLNWPKSAFKSN